MLYSEFIEGTQKPDNKWTYSEYERINRIYNTNNEMSKQDAYKLYQDPDSLTQSLLEDAAIWKAYYVEKSATADKAQKTIEELNQTIKELREEISEIHHLARRISYMTGSDY